MLRRISLSKLLLVSIYCLSITVSLHGQTRIVIGSGIVNATEATAVAHGTVGQPVIGRTSSSIVSGSLGFWYRAIPTSNVAVAEASGEDFSISVVPNPLSIHGTIQLQTTGAGSLDVMLCDLLGRGEMAIISEQVEAGQHHFGFDASAFSSGLYLLTLRFNNERATIPIQIIR